MPDRMVDTPSGGRVPVPDPTLLTTEALKREVAGLRELFEARLDAMDKAIILLQAFNDRQPTIAEVVKTIDGIKNSMDQRFYGFKELMDERFSSLSSLSDERLNGIKTQFAERDIQIERASRDVKSAVDAAFAAAKEAVAEQNKSNATAIAKSEAATTKQIDSMLDLFKSSGATIDGKIGDVKDRLTVIESKTSVSDPTTTAQLSALNNSVNNLSTNQTASSGHSRGLSDGWAYMVGAAGIAVAVSGAIGLALKFIH